MLARLKRLWIAIAAVGMLAAASASLAQRFVLQQIQPNFQVNTNPNPGAEDLNTVYVRDSAIAMEQLSLARRLERASEWAKAADVYQEILEKYPDRVVPAAEDPQTHIVLRYTSVTQTVRDSLCKWPIEGLSVYRGRFETPAAALLQSAGDDGLNKLHEVMWRYFPTESAKAAGIRLMDIYFEQGDFAAAAEIGKQLLDGHPDLSAERPMVLYRTALASKLIGQPDQAAARLDELRRQFPQATGSIRGQDVLLADSLAKEFATAAITGGQTGDSWVTVGGDDTRGKISISIVKPGARLYAIPLMKYNWEQAPAANRPQLQGADDDQRKKGAGLGIMPVVDKGELFFQDNTRIFAMDLDGGVPLPAWLDTYPSENGAYKAPGDSPPQPLGKQLCISVNDKYVVAVMGLSDPLSSAQGPPNPESRLVCLDRKTGKDRWTFTPQDFPDAQAALHELHMGGAPLMVGDNVYVMVHGTRGQFEDCYVACFSLASGQFRWATFIANSSTEGAFGQMGYDPTYFSDAVSHIAYAGGRLFIVSNIGAIASLDAYSGTIAWLSIYRTDNQMSAARFNNPMIPGGAVIVQPNNLFSAAMPWIYNPAIVQGGQVFALPSDGRSLFIYDTDTGNLIKQIPLADSNLLETRDSSDSYVPDVPTTLLAVRGDMVYLAGARQVWQIPWKEVDADKSPDAIDGYWRSADSSDPASQVHGRAFVTADAVYLPTQSSLKRIGLATGSIQSSYPKNGWEEGKEGPGNIIVTQDHVIVAGDAQVAVYTDIALARAKLDRDIAAAPADADVRLHYAEVMFAGAQPDIAETRLREAFELLGGIQSPRPGSSRDRAFEDALSFARRSAQKNENPAQTDRFFDLAQSAANSPSEQVKYRLARADFDWTRPTRDAAAAIALYQEILCNADFRAIPMPDPITSNASTAGDIADAAVSKIKQTPDGQLAYEKYETLAAQKLADAKAASDPDQLLEVARAFPDARITEQVMMTAAGMYENRGNSKMATQVLRQILRMHQSETPVDVLEALARNYLRMPGHLDVAVGGMQRAAAISPDQMLIQPMTLPSGAVLENVSLGSACEYLMRYEAEISLESLPDLRLPTHEQARAYRAQMGQWASPFQSPAASAKIDGVDAMIAPLEDFTRKDRIIAWSGANGLAVYGIGGATPLFTSAGISSAPSGAAWLAGGLLIWTDETMSLLDANTGAQKWAVDFSKLPRITAAGDNDDNQQANGPDGILQVVPTSERVIATTTAGRLLAIDLRQGHILWQMRSGNSSTTMVASDDFAVIRYADGQAVNLEAYNAATGDPVGKKSFGIDTGNVPINLALAADGTLVYTLPAQICIQDLFQANLTPQGMDPQHMTDVPQNQVPIFQGSGQPEPDQLLIHSGRIFAVASSGKEVRIYPLEGGDLWVYHSRGGSTTSGVFATDSTSPAVHLKISGNYLFCFSPRNLIAYRVDPPTEHWESYFDPTKATNYQQVIFGRDYLSLIDRPSQPLSESNRAGNKVTLSFFNRAVKGLGPDKEGGLLVFTVDVPVLENNIAIQAIDGGIAVFTGHSIQRLMGARDSLPGAPPI